MSAIRSEEITSRVAKRIKELRATRGFTQESLARALGIATKNVQRLEGGKQNLTLRTLEAVASVLDVEAQDLLARPGTALSVDATSSLDRAMRAIERAGHRVIAQDEAQPPGAIPVMRLEAAAGRFRDVKSVEVFAWIKFKGLRVDQTIGRFVTQVVGNSMIPHIPSGALCLFRTPVVGSLTGRVVLVQLRTATDVDDAGTYVVKRIGSIELRPEGGLRVQLLSDNRDFPPISVDVQQANDLGILAELERIVWPSSPSRRSARS